MIYGLDCPHCTHDTVTSFRLRMQLCRNNLCTWCGSAGTPIEMVNLWTDQIERNWYDCPRCHDQWQATWAKERNDLVFRASQLDSALAQMYALGWDNPEPGKVHAVDAKDDTRHTIPHGYAARLMELREQAMPRTALYFRWNPMAERPEDRILTPEKIFQCVFHPDDSQAQRRVATEMPVSKEDCELIIQADPKDRSFRGFDSSIKCHHCGKALPLRALSTTALREVEKGD